MRWILRDDDEPNWPQVGGIFIADTPERCREALKIVRALDVCGVDVESYGVNLKKESPVKRSKMISIQFASDYGPQVFVPLWSGHGNDVDPQGRIKNLQIFKEWLEDSDFAKCGSNIKHDMHNLANYGITLRGVAGDTQVMDYLWANGEQRHALKECMRRYFKDDTAIDYTDVFRTPKIGKGGRILKTTHVPPLTDVIVTQEGVNKLVKYACKDPAMSTKLFRFLRDKMKETTWTKKGSYWDFYERFHLPYTTVLFEMEREGCPVDVEKLKHIERRMAKTVDSLARKFMRMCVEEGVPQSYLLDFNMGSGDQLADLLYEKLGFSPSPGKLDSGVQFPDGPAYFTSRGPSARVYSFSWTTPSLRATSV